MRLIEAFCLGAIVCTLILPSLTVAQSSEDENFDSIVQRLSQPKPAQIRNYDDDPFANLRLHGGVGMSQSVTYFSGADGDERFAQKGIQAAIGVDLFSPNWIAEGALVNYATSLIGDSQVSLREFDLRIYYHRTKGYFWTYTLGGGVAARYLTIARKDFSSAVEFATPSTIAFAGLMARINANISLTTEMAVRYALIEDTQDKSAFNLTFRIDTHF
jgi:hypothetical protein